MRTKRFEVSTVGFDGCLQTVGSDASGGDGWLGLPIPITQPASAQGRYTFLLALARFGIGEEATLVGMRQYVELAACIDASLPYFGLLFDGSNYVTVPADPAFSPANAFTFESWVNFTSSGQAIWGNADPGTNWCFRNTGGRVAFSCVFTGVGATGFASAPINDGLWHHVAATYDGTTFAYWVDGVAVGASVIGADTLVTSVGTMVFGNTGARTSAYYVGTLGQVRISNVARYSAPFTPPPFYNIDTNTVAYWPFVNSGGGMTNDVSGNGHNGTLFGSPAPTFVTDDPGGSPSQQFPVKLVVDSPTWRFVDGNVMWALRRIRPTDPGFYNSANADGLQWRMGPSPAQLFESVGPPILPPFNGQLPGDAFEPNLAQFYDLRFPWQSNNAARILRVPIVGPCTIALFASVMQTDPATRLQMPGTKPFSTDTGISREDAFVANYGSCARYSRIAGSLIFQQKYSHIVAGGMRQR